MELELFISTLGRADKQVTLHYLTPDLLSKTSMVVVPQEKVLYEKKYGSLIKIVTLPKNVVGLSANRQWLLEQAKAEMTVFLDDDLEFHVRDDKGRLLKATKESFYDLINLWKEWLTLGYALVGVSTKGGNNRTAKDFEDNTRVMSAYAFSTDVLKNNSVRFDRIGAMQDFDVALQLLELGYKNRVSFKFAHSQAYGSGSTGGCSAYRSAEFKRRAAFRLVELHPRTVMVRAKVSKSSWKEMEQRKGIKGTLSTDVTIFWKKAYKPRTRASGSGIERWF